jgi:hypothetical protein
MHKISTEAYSMAFGPYDAIKAEVERMEQVGEISVIWEQATCVDMSGGEVFLQIPYVRLRPRVELLPSARRRLYSLAAVTLTGGATAWEGIRVDWEANAALILGGSLFGLSVSWVWRAWKREAS